MALRLHGLLAGLPEVRVKRVPEASSVFVDFSPGVAEAVRGRGWRFYDFIAGAGSRLMTAWDTGPEDLDALVADVKAALASRR